VQRVSIELAQSVEFEQTDRADRVLIDSYRISWSCHFVVRKDFRGSFPGSTQARSPRAHGTCYVTCFIIIYLFLYLLIKRYIQMYCHVQREQDVVMSF